MPTPGERRALIFIASVAALGVAVRGWREFHPPDSGALAGNRAALARQIEAVDSAIAVSPAKRKARAPRAESPRPEPAPRAAKGRGRAPAPVDTQPRDPRQAYWDRIARSDSISRSEDRAQHESAERQTRMPPAVRQKSLPSLKKWETPPIDLDLATLGEVSGVPEIGPALAARIVRSRINDGPFGSITGLMRIPGITPAFAHRLEPFVTFSGTPRLDSAGERRPRSKSTRRPGGDSRP
jgi:hypothetical protein